MFESITKPSVNCNYTILLEIGVLILTDSNDPADSTLEKKGAEHHFQSVEADDDRIKQYAESVKSGKILSAIPSFGSGTL